jgi:SAM-dependent methyltransferase
MSLTYEEQVRAQIEQFSDARMRWMLPPVHKYWMKSYVWPHLNNVFGAVSHIDIYADSAMEFAEPRILSVGSGDGNLEIAIAQKLRDSGKRKFKILLTELSPIRQERAKAAVFAAGFESNFEYQIIDFNTDFPAGAFDVVLAHHTLHHIVELEVLLENIKKSIGARGAFVTMDMIGRNGHMRWPEALKYVEAAWKFMPDRLKYNFQMNRFHEDYINFDCSKVGFEGVRAQDILPLLVEKFWFEGFVGAGGFVDPIFERGYGQSFDMTAARDVGLVDFLSMTNDVLIRSGEIKPTMIFAVMRAERPDGGQTRQVDHLSPAFCIRLVDA